MRWGSGATAVERNGREESCYMKFSPSVGALRNQYIVDVKGSIGKRTL